MVWRKADNAASREELTAAVTEMKDAFETHRKEDRESFRQIFASAEQDRKETRNGVQEIIREMRDAENRLRDKIDAK
jgi:uncharacterized membrane protein